MANLKLDAERRWGVFRFKGLSVSLLTAFALRPFALSSSSQRDTYRGLEVPVGEMFVFVNSVESTGGGADSPLSTAIGGVASAVVDASAAWDPSPAASW